MLSPWLELPTLSETLEGWSASAGRDLAADGTTADADAIRDTAVAQPLIVAGSLLSLLALLRHGGATDGADSGDGEPATEPRAAFATVAAGHSVGEFAALTASGVLSPADALGLVGVRGAAMARAAAQSTTGMSAVVGGDPAEVLSVLTALGLVAANMNGGGQVVAAGDLDALGRLAAEPPAKARVIPLQVAGAFHTEHMRPAVAEVAARAAALSPADPGTVLLSNADGRPVEGGADAIDRVVAQIARPVRWDLCQETLQELGVTAVLELAPAGVLTGLARRTLPGVEAVALKSPADLDAAWDLVQRHGGPAASAPGVATDASPAPQSEENRA